jgi:hypothetical protein
MSTELARDRFTPLTEREVASAIERARKEHRRIVDDVQYNPRLDALVIVAGSLAVLCPRLSIPELREVPVDDMNEVRLSAGRATIQLLKRDVFIEAAGLVARALNEMRRTHKGGLLMDLLSERWS